MGSTPANGDAACGQRRVHRRRTGRPGQAPRKDNVGDVLADLECWRVAFQVCNRAHKRARNVVGADGDGGEVEQSDAVRHRLEQTLEFKHARVERLRRGVGGFKDLEVAKGNSSFLDAAEESPDPSDAARFVPRAVRTWDTGVWNGEVSLAEGEGEAVERGEAGQVLRDQARDGYVERAEARLRRRR